MKISLFLVGFAALLVMPSPFLMPAASAQEGSKNPLASYRDKQRVLLVFAPNAQDAGYQTQRKLWKDEEAGFKERQLTVLHLLADDKTDTPAVLGKRFGVDPQNFRVILIGKDGHDAFQSKQPVSAETIFQRIDTMPMRREEMKRQQAKS